LRWVASAGGPLICIESDAVSMWCGVAGSVGTNGQCHDSMPNDYERACAVRDYAGTIDLPQDRKAIIFGDMPLSTTVVRDTKGQLLIVRVFFMEPETNIEAVVRAIPDSEFGAPIETLLVDVHTERFLIFDSAFPGIARKDTVLSFELPVSSHIILTMEVAPDEKTSLLIHKFVPNGRS
jgi:hypothetical protein